MQICRELAGYSYGRADIVRRAMSKKKHDVMLRERENFVHGTVDENGNIICEGAIRRGISEKAANEIFDEMISFASYAFNKAHAAAYAFVAYRTAWLKCHYPCEFMAAIMTSFLDNTGKVVQYINECNKLGIRMLPPHINRSLDSFSVSDGNIHYSLLAVKNLGRGFIKNIIHERTENGDFKDFYEFCKRMHGKELNRRAVESLIKCGAFDSMGANRKQMISVMDSVIDDLDNSKRRNVDGQIGFFDLESDDAESEEISDNFTYPETDEFPVELLLKYEKEVSGLYLSGHPMAKYKDLSIRLNCSEIGDIIDEELDKYKDNEHISVLGLVSDVKKKITKNDSTMAFVTLEDSTGSIETLVFSKVFTLHPSLFTEGNIILVHGKVSKREDEDTKLVCELAEPCPPENYAVPKKEETLKEKKKASGLFLRFDTPDSPQIEYCRRLLSIFDGTVPLYYYFNSTKEYFRNPIGQAIDVNDVLLRELRKILGENNVIFNG